MSVGIIYTKPTDQVTPLTVASAFDNALDKVNTGFTSHMNGDADQTVPGVVRHSTGHIKQGNLNQVISLPSSLINPVTQDVMNNVFASMWYALIGANAGTNYTGRLTTFVAKTTLEGMWALLQSHSHLDSTHGGVLTQAATHGSADTDGGLSSIHHTLGTGAFQAAAGNHLHTGVYVPSTDKGAASGVATLDGSSFVPLAQIPSGIARVTDLSAYVPSTAKGAASGVATLDGTVHLPDAQLPTTAARLTDLAGYIPASAKGAASGVAALDGSSLISAINIPSAIARVTDLAAYAPLAHVHGSGGVPQIATGGLADGAVTEEKWLPGRIVANGGLTVWVNPIKKYNDSGAPVHWDGGSVDLSTYVPASSGQKRYVLLQLNSVAALYAKAGSLTSGTLGDSDMPSKDPDYTPLGYVALTFAETAIVQGDIKQWQGPGQSGGLAGGGSQIGHIHGGGSESLVAAYGLSEGWAHPTNTVSMSIQIEGLHFKNSSGISKYKANTTVGPFTAPVSNPRIDAVYLDPVSEAYVILPGNEAASPTPPAFAGSRRAICYVHLFTASTVIRAGSVGADGWIEDARDWIASGGVSSIPVGVAEGGSGQIGFVQGLIWQSSAGSPTTPLQVIPASSSSTAGLAIAPSPTGMGAASTVDVLQLGGGAVANGTTVLSRINAVHIVSPTKDTGATTDLALLTVDAPAMAGATNNVSAIFAGFVRMGSTAIPTQALDVAGGVQMTGNIGIGGPLAATVQEFSSGTFAPASTGTLWGKAQNTVLKPTLAGGSAIFSTVANLGSVDTSALTAIGDGLTSAYGLQVGAVSRSDGGTNPSVFSVSTLTPSLSITGGTYDIGDGTHTASGIAYNAALGTYSTAATIVTLNDNLNTINQKLAIAGVLYTATGGPLSSGTALVFTANVTNPGKKAVLIVTPHSITGGTLTFSLTTAGKPYVSNAYGIFVNPPTAGITNYAFYTPGGRMVSDGSAGAAMTDGSWSSSANLLLSRNMNGSTQHDSLLSVQGFASGDAGNSEKAGISLFMRQANDSTATPHDLCGMEMQTYVAPSNPYGRTWVAHMQSNILGTAPGTDGNTVIIEMQVQNDGSDGQYIGHGTTKQKGGISTFAGGPQNATFAYFVQTGPSNDGLSAGRFWHAYYVDPAGLVADNSHGGAFQLAGLFNVKHDGRMSSGTDVPMTGVQADIRGDVRSTGMHRFGTGGQNTTLATSGNIDPANGQVQRFSLAGSVTGINLLPPAAARHDGAASAGSTPILILINESASNTIAFNAVYNSTTNAVLGAVTIAARTSQIYVWDGAATSWYKVV